MDKAGLIYCFIVSTGIGISYISLLLRMILVNDQFIIGVVGFGSFLVSYQDFSFHRIYCGLKHDW